MKQLEVQIMDQSYLLGCPEGGEARLRAAVERVDATMQRIREAGKVRARDRIAVLAALNLAFDVIDRAPEPPSITPAAAAPGADEDGARWRHLLARLDEALDDRPPA
ncbi:cell division protein ZapA [Xylophilus ampelinus]|uniref:Cell division protein ZapA n=1 Tax=Xylophilus ampelinus TaxID=54067 RepID=A0A318SJD6_9BURK|nr:cell division protein ZapA [Xylophilus ampelinus]MCS4509915.1 cell division protein ZapA [Xylophilus ampelinus]PYE78535.1 cell division protein ZapA [Xylophilus ampelinus]